MNNKIELYTEILAIEPNSKVFFPLARLLSDAGRHDEAVSALEHGLGFHPDHLEAKFLLVEILTRQGREDQADAAFGDVGALLARYPAVWLLWSKHVHVQAKDPSLAMLFLARYFENQNLTWTAVMEQGLGRLGQAASRGPATFPGEVPTGKRPETVCAATAADAASAVAGPDAAVPSQDQDVAGGPSLRGAREVLELAALLEAPEEAGEKVRARSAKSREPGVRTRTMAALLAEQGDAAGALEIYNELLAAAGSDAERDELACLIQALSPAAKTAAAPQPAAPQADSASGGSLGAGSAAKPRSAAKLVNILEALAGRLEARAGQ